jgi:hypothetical protein
MFISRPLAALRASTPAAVTVLIVASALAAPAQQTWAQSGDPCAVLYGVDSSTDNLSLIDLESRTTSVVGLIGTDTPVAIATRPSDGQVFVWDNTSSTLRTVDTCTGLGTPLREPHPNSSTTLYDLVFTPEGRLFGLGYSAYELDPETGQSHAMGQFRDQDGAAIDLISAAAYAPDGRLFAVAGSDLPTVPIDLGLLDVYTSRFHFVVRLDLPTADVPQDLFFGPDGTMYLAAIHRVGFPEEWILFRIDPTTGAAQPIWSGFLLQGVAYAFACGVSPDACLQRVRDITIDFNADFGRGSGVVTWTAISETDVRGFNIVRIDDTGTRTRLNRALIPCEECVTGAPHTYIFSLPKRRDGQQLYIETVRTGGQSEIYGPASRL